MSPVEPCSTFSSSTPMDIQLPARKTKPETIARGDKSTDARARRTAQKALEFVHGTITAVNKGGESKRPNISGLSFGTYR